ALASRAAPYRQNHDWVLGDRNIIVFALRSHRYPVRIGTRGSLLVDLRVCSCLRNALGPRRVLRPNRHRIQPGQRDARFIELGKTALASVRTKLANAQDRKTKLHSISEKLPA